MFSFTLVNLFIIKNKFFPYIKFSRFFF